MRFTVQPLPHRTEAYPNPMRPTGPIDPCVTRAADAAMDAVLADDRTRRPWGLPDAVDQLS